MQLTRLTIAKVLLQTLFCFYWFRFSVLLQQMTKPSHHKKYHRFNIHILKISSNIKIYKEGINKFKKIKTSLVKRKLQKCFFFVNEHLFWNKFWIFLAFVNISEKIQCIASPLNTWVYKQNKSQWKSKTY